MWPLLNNQLSHGCLPTVESADSLLAVRNQTVNCQLSNGWLLTRTQSVNHQPSNGWLLTINYPTVNSWAVYTRIVNGQCLTQLTVWVSTLVHSCRIQHSYFKIKCILIDGMSVRLLLSDGQLTIWGTEGSTVDGWRLTLWQSTWPSLGPVQMVGTWLCICIYLRRCNGELCNRDARQSLHACWGMCQGDCCGCRGLCKFHGCCCFWSFFSSGHT